MPRPRKNAAQSTGSTGSTRSTVSTGSTGTTGGNTGYAGTTATAASTGTESKITHGQAAYVLDRLIAERRVTRTDVNRYVAEMGREISELERRLTALREAHGGAIAAVAATVAAGAAAAVAVARRRPGRPAGRPAAIAVSATATPATPGRRPGRPVGSGRKPGRPAGSGATSASATPTAISSTDVPAASGSTGGAQGGAKRGRKATAEITAGQLASRQLQGRYLALVRQFPENKRAQYARTAKERGREIAIREMQDALKR
ncbi:MAG TPA: hypothetical protein VF911_21420 [Thermoanaerobaculia bacterium]|jgi:hypothetical protein